MPTTDRARNMTPELMRAEMPIAGRVAYFDHAAVSPLPGPTSRAVGKWLEEVTTLGDVAWPRWAALIEQTRASVANLINATKDEVALVPNTTTAINIVAEGLDWRSGDNIVTLADEYPSNVYPWMNQQSRGVETRFVETDRGRLDLDKLRAACDDRTRVVALSWVEFAGGYRHQVDQVADIAHSAGALLLLDAIQGLGVFPFDVRQSGVDFLAANGQKWLLSPEGCGMLYLRQEHLGSLRPIGVGAGSVENRWDYSTIDFTLRETAGRYESGCMNVSSFIGLGASIDFLARWAPGELARAVLEVTDLAVDRLRAIGAEVHSHREPESGGHDPRSGIVSFTIPGQDPNDVRKRCAKADVALSCRGGRLRIAPHGYTNRDDIEQMIEAISSTAES